MAPKKEEKDSPKHETAVSPKRLYRSEHNRILGGVAGGFGEYFHVDPTLVRILFIIMTVFGGGGVILYLILWLIIPTESSSTHISEETLRENAGDIKKRVQSMAADLKYKRPENDSKFLWGTLILLFGLLFLLQNLGFLGFMSIGKLWPLVLIFFGVSLLLKKS